MSMFIRRVSRLENHIDTSLEKFVFHHQFLGFFMILIGMPLAILATVCVCTTLIALPIAFVFGWI